jgi:hypothetical protein
MKLFFDVKLVAENNGVETVLFSARQETVPGGQPVPVSVPMPAQSMPMHVQQTELRLPSNRDDIDAHIWQKLSLGTAKLGRKRSMWRLYVVDRMADKGHKTNEISRRLGLGLSVVSAMRNRSGSYRQNMSPASLKVKIETALTVAKIDPKTISSVFSTGPDLNEMVRLYKADCYLAQGMSTEDVAVKSGLPFNDVRRRASGKLRASEPTKEQVEVFIASHGVPEDIAREMEQSVEQAARKAALTVGG